jgi:hypothetical protein
MWLQYLPLLISVAEREKVKTEKRITINSSATIYQGKTVTIGQAFEGTMINVGYGVVVAKGRNTTTVEIQSREDLSALAPLHFQGKPGDELDVENDKLFDKFVEGSSSIVNFFNQFQSGTNERRNNQLRHHVRDNFGEQQNFQQEGQSNESQDNENQEEKIRELEEKLQQKEDAKEHYKMLYKSCMQFAKQITQITPSTIPRISGEMRRIPNFNTAEREFIWVPEQEYIQFCQYDSLFYCLNLITWWFQITIDHVTRHGMRQQVLTYINNLKDKTYTRNNLKLAIQYIQEKKVLITDENGHFHYQNK